jgi:Ca2+-binding EF-hand superfamily protein
MNNKVLSAAQKKEIAEIFNLFDTDGSGSMDIKEIEIALLALGIQRSSIHSHNDRVTNS